MRRLDSTVCAKPGVNQEALEDAWRWWVEVEWGHSDEGFGALVAGIAKVAVRLRLGDLDPDAGFWCSRPASERVAHVRELQACYYSLKGEGSRRMLLGKDLHDFVSLCLGHGVRFLVVGGYAVAAHGHPRLTRDLDVWVWVDPENAARMVRALGEFGFESLGLTAGDFSEEGRVVQLGYPPNRIDIMTSIDGVEFENCWDRRAEIVLDSLAVPFIGLEDLEKNKLTTGRTQDIADVEGLRQSHSL